MGEAMPQVQKPDLERSLTAGAYYFQIVFAIGFALGTLRVLALVPALGELGAVLIELPIILAASWWISGRLIHRFKVPSEHRLTMGALAFTLLILAEAVLSIFLFGRTFAQHMAHYRTLPGAVGLAGQLLFAAMPALHKRS
jgi:hypothetical protein